MHGIKAELLIPGRGSPVHDAAVVVDGPQIAWVGEEELLPAEYKTLTFISVPVIMPGLWDWSVCRHFLNFGFVLGLV